MLYRIEMYSLIKYKYNHKQMIMELRSYYCDRYYILLL
jgi:hypothetical protein